MTDAPQPAGGEPLFRYDAWTESEVIRVLGSLTPADRATLGAYERAHLARPAILARIALLGDRGPRRGVTPPVVSRKDS